MSATASTQAATAVAAAHRIPDWLLYGISFWGGFEIMVLEICGFRVLPTYLGSSVIVTGTLLTVFMLLMSAGYYAGGLFSVVAKRESALFFLLILAAAYAKVAAGDLSQSIALLVVSLRGVLPSHAYFQTGVPTAVLTFLLYGPPVFIASLASPYLIHLRSARDAEQGATAGRQSGLFMALATFGSIAGTVLGSFALVPFAGVELTVNISAALLFVLAVFGWVKLEALSPRVQAARVFGAVCVATALVVVSSAFGPS